MSSWGIIGIGRIGLSMARNMSSKDISLSLYDKTFDKKLNPIFATKKLYPELKSTLVFKDISSFVDSIQKPRKILVLVPSGKINNGLGIAIISTPKGVMSDIDARKQKIGGEIICKVF